MSMLPLSSRAGRPRKTIDQVPAIIRDEVKQILKDLEVEV